MTFEDAVHAVAPSPGGTSALAGGHSICRRNKELRRDHKSNDANCLHHEGSLPVPINLVKRFKKPCILSPCEKGKKGRLWPRRDNVRFRSLADISTRSPGCLFTPENETFFGAANSSAKCQKRTLIKRGKRCLLYTSKRTLLSVGLDVRFVPKADMSDWFLVAALGREGALIPIRGRIVAVLTIWRWIAAIRWRKSVDHQARGLVPEGRPFLVTESSPRARHGSVVLRLRQRIKVGLCISPTGKATNRGWRRQRSNCQCPML